MLKQAYYAAGSLAAHVQQRQPLGRSIFAGDWDICIVLDSTRLDMLREQWPRDDAVGAVWSRGSITTEWLANTFRRSLAATLDDTAYVSASPHSHTVFRDREWLTNAEGVSVRYPEPPVVSPADFAGFHEVWRTHASEADAVPPETMLDATLEAAERYDRVVAHWLQPHEPFIGGGEYFGGGPTETNVWQALQDGSVDEATVWAAYRSNLHRALAAVDMLLDSIDAEVLITSDHGNAFGRFGVYGHPFAWPEPVVRRVPWIKTRAEAVSGYDYTSVLNDADGGTGLKAQLRALGYA